MSEATKQERFRQAANKQLKQLGREVEYLTTQNSQLQAEIERLRPSKTTTSTNQNDLTPLLTSGDLNFAPLPIQSMTISTSNPLCIETNPINPHLVCIGCANKEVLIINWKDSKILKKITTTAPVLTVRHFILHPNLVLVGGMDGSCHLIDVDQEKIVLTWRDHDSFVLDLRIDDQSNGLLRCVTVSRDKSCIISALVYNEQDNEWSRTKLRSFFFQGCVEAVTFIDPVIMKCNEDLIVSVRNNCNLIYCNIKDNTKRLWNMNEKGDDHVSFTVLRMELSPSKQYLLLTTDAHRIFIIGNGTNGKNGKNGTDGTDGTDGSNGTITPKILRNFYGHTADGMSTPRCQWHKSEKYILSNAQKDCACHIWSVASERTETQLNGHDRAVRDLSSTCNGSYLCTVSYDKTLKIWKMEDDLDVPLAPSTTTETKMQTPAVLSSIPTPTPATTTTTTTTTTFLTLNEYDQNLIKLEKNLSSVSLLVQNIESTNPKRVLLKKETREIKKTIKEMTRNRKNHIRLIDVQKRKDKSILLSQDPFITAIVTDPTDVNVLVYTNMKDATASYRTNKFITEGTEPIRLLLESDLIIDSLYLKPTIYQTLKPYIIARYAKHAQHLKHSKEENKVEETNEKQYVSLPPIQIFISTSSIMADVAGYQTARGSFACGTRPNHSERNEKWLYTNILVTKKKKWRILAIDGCNNTANLGSLIRTSTALGVDGK